MKIQIHLGTKNGEKCLTKNAIVIKNRRQGAQCIEVGVQLAQVFLFCRHIIDISYKNRMLVF